MRGSCDLGIGFDLKEHGESDDRGKGKENFLSCVCFPNSLKLFGK